MRNHCLLLLSVATAAAVAEPASAIAQKPMFNHTTIYVTDLHRAADFYHRVMLLDTIPEPFHDRSHIWFGIGPTEHYQLHVVAGAKADVPHDENIHLAFTVPDLAAFARHLDAMGVKYGNWNQTSKTPQSRPDGVQQIYLRDPDGYWLEVNNDGQ